MVVYYQPLLIHVFECKYIYYICVYLEYIICRRDFRNIHITDTEQQFVTSRLVPSKHTLLCTHLEPEFVECTRAIKMILKVVTSSICKY